MNYSATLSVLLILVGGCFAQNNINCRFLDQLSFGYSCLVVDATISEDDSVVFVGDHIEDRTSLDVRGIFFTESNLARVPMEIFEEFPNIETIDVSNSELSTLNQFENCSSLTSFIASGNQLEIVQPETFEECNNLSFLDLSNNSISYYHSRGLGNLRELRLNLNQLKTFSNDSFGPLVNLQFLDLSFNQIEIINPIMLWSLGNLRELILDFNRISRVFAGEFNSLINLERLTIRTNDLVSIHPTGLLGLQSLRELDLSRNRLTDISGIFRNTPALENITVNSNFISRLGRNTFENNPSLRIIDLHSNEINVISGNVFDHLTNLTELIFSSNTCVDEHFILDPPGNIQAILPNLQQCINDDQTELTCTFVQHVEGYTCWILDGEVLEGTPVTITINHLENRTNDDVYAVRFFRSTLSFIPLEFFDIFPNMRFFEVGNSMLPSLAPLRNCSSLTSFNASGNLLEIIQPETFEECNNLSFLDLSNNVITHYHSRGLGNLRELRLNRNQLITFSNDSFGPLVNLQVLDLSYNFIEIINPIMLWSLGNLRELSLNFNRISRIFAGELSSLINLDKLTLQSNDLASIHPTGLFGLQSLRELDLSRNRLTDISGIFRNTPALENITVSNNFILRLGRNTFENNTGLRIIDLQRNGINVISENVFDHLTNLTELNFLENACVNEHFIIDPPGNIQAILPNLQQCINNDQTELTCTFVQHVEGYTCWILDGEVLEGTPVTITINHLENRTNDDVYAVRFFRSTISHIPLEFFDLFPNMRFFDVTNSRLPSLTPLRNCSNLETVVGTLNSIQTVAPNVFAECGNLINLNLAYNQIRDFNSSGLEGLQFLNLNGNNISQIIAENFINLRNLEVLSLENNNLSRIDFEAFGQDSVLHSLFLGNNQITHLNASANPLRSLRTLSLINNHIENLDEFSLFNLANLETLLLPVNRISNLNNPFASLSSLRFAILTNNQISTIPRNTFENNLNLLEIDLQFNNISLIESDAFSGLQELNYLRLRGNICIDEDFIGLGGNITEILPSLERCLAVTMDNMSCNFDVSAVGYSCQVGSNQPFLVRTIRFQ